MKQGARKFTGTMLAAGLLTSAAAGVMPQTAANKSGAFAWIDSSYQKKTQNPRHRHDD